MLHRFSIAAGRVSYANRFLASQAYRAAERDGEISYSEFAQTPAALSSPPRRRLSPPDLR